ncbi:MAG: hypothetical protein ABSG05_00035 [Candidatus Pacearchaeota archaeon]|jgi:DNA polymerase (family 10)
MKLKHVFKKGREVTTREGSFVIKLAKKIASDIKQFCKKIEIGGSIRRKSKNPTDIDIILIPKNEGSKKEIEEVLSRKGKRVLGGEQKAYFKIDGVETEIYYTTPEEWGAALMAYSSPFGASIGLRVIARAKGFKLNQHGLFKHGKMVAGRTEEEIYKVLGRPWKPPEKR